MFGANDATDKALLKSVTQRLARGTASQIRITATVQAGTVTLNGTLRYEAQRIPVVKEVGRIAGVRRVVDQLKAPPKTARPMGPPRPPIAPVVADGAPPEQQTNTGDSADVDGEEIS
jgi:hypothetical protein